MSVSFLSVVFPSTREFAIFCAMATPWVETAESDANGVMRGDVLMYGDHDNARMQVYNAGGNEVTTAPVTDDEEVEVVACPHCGGLAYYPAQVCVLTCDDCGEDFAICAVFDDESPVDPDPDQHHCDECGEIIDNAYAGCQSDPDGGCKGWDYRRDSLGL